MKRYRTLITWFPRKENHLYKGNPIVRIPEKQIQQVNTL